jgi:hypothetical protein
MGRYELTLEGRELTRIAQRPDWGALLQPGRLLIGDRHLRLAE